MRQYCALWSLPPPTKKPRRRRRKLRSAGEPPPSMVKGPNSAAEAYSLDRRAYVYRSDKKGRRIFTGVIIVCSIASTGLIDALQLYIWASEKPGRINSVKLIEHLAESAGPIAESPNVTCNHGMDHVLIKNC
jgi:hypothetical protein